tara:strand:+ start:1233 stop:1511 length:279 start_codon:yes stop_codon:yes gene_type:complete
MNKLNDNMFLGILIGILVPVFVYALLLSVFHLFLDENPLRESTMQVISLFVNFPVFRKFLMEYKKDRLGRGMLLSTLVLAAWFIIHNKMLFF